MTMTPSPETEKLSNFAKNSRKFQQAAAEVRAANRGGKLYGEGSKSKKPTSSLAIPTKRLPK